MLDRTASGHDIRYKKFDIYSKSYAKKKGVPRNEVDMELTSKMLSNAKVKRANIEDIQIAITQKKEKLKSYNHNYGDTLPKREFFGNLLKDAKLIAKEVLIKSQSEMDSEEKAKLLEYVDSFTVAN